MKFRQIAAHVGNVTDLAFSHLNKQLCITSCGEDKSIKVWFILHCPSLLLVRLGTAIIKVHIYSGLGCCNR